ncbi:alpha-mannosidase, partial [Candidatus Hydrogenedentota bacterium]
RRMKDLEGCSKLSFGNASKFLEGLRERDVEIPKWVGELYLELHRGVHTTHARIKRYNRKLEFLLREVEMLSVIATENGRDYPEDELRRIWRVVLTNQFHDILPGSCITPVYEVVEAEYAQVEKELTKIKNRVLDTLAANISTNSTGAPCIVFNPLSWQRDDVTLIETPCTSAKDEEGNALDAQQIINGKKKCLAVKMAVNALELKPIYLGKAASSIKSTFKHTAYGLQTPHYRVRFDKAGKIVSLFDKAAQREVVQKGRRLNDIYSAEDMPHNDAWEIAKHYRELITPEDRLVSREIVADGPLLTTIRSNYEIGKCSTLTQDMVFYAHSRRIDFQTKVDWQETHVLLKAGFPVDIEANSCRNEIQFGHLVRDMHNNTCYDEAKYETCAHKWVDVSEGDYGVAILNDCKYGLDTLDDMISLTLLRSPTAPDIKADKGAQEFTYSILPHTGGFSVETAVREAYQLNVPLSIRKAKKGGGTARAVQFCEVSSPNVIVETIKKAEESDAVIVRVYEARKARCKTSIKFSRPVKKVFECNMLEREDVPVPASGDSINFEILPFEIKTFKVFFK